MVAAGKAYRDRMARYARMKELDLWYDGTHVDSLIKYFAPADRGQCRSTSRRSPSAAPSRGAFAKLTAMVQGQPRIDEDPPLRTHIDDDEQDA